MDTWVGPARVAGVLWLLSAVALTRFITPINLGFMALYAAAGLFLLFRRSPQVMRLTWWLAILTIASSARYLNVRGIDWLIVLPPAFAGLVTALAYLRARDDACSRLRRHQTETPPPGLSLPGRGSVSV